MICIDVFAFKDTHCVNGKGTCRCYSCVQKSVKKSLPIELEGFFGQNYFNKVISELLHGFRRDPGLDQLRVSVAAPRALKWLMFV